MIRNWHICISGFLQRSGRPNGIMSLWRKLRFLSSPETEVMLVPWKFDTWSVAETIWLTGGDWQSLADCEEGKAVVTDVTAKVYIYAYSWGAGWGATRLINELRKRGIKVRYCVFSDPVFRSSYLPDMIPFNPSTWLGRYPVRINDNVAEVRWFYQNSNKPAAHNVVKMHDETEQKTIIHPGERLHGVTHQYMDDEPRFHAAAIQVAKESMTHV